MSTMDSSKAFEICTSKVPLPPKGLETSVSCRAFFLPGDDQDRISWNRTPILHGWQYLPLVLA